LIIFK